MKRMRFPRDNNTATKENVGEWTENLRRKLPVKKQ